MTGLGHTRYEEAVIRGKQVPDPAHAGKMRDQKSARQAHEESRTDYGQSFLRESIDVLGYWLLQEATHRSKGNAPSLSRVTLRKFFPPDVAAARNKGESMPAYQRRLGKLAATRQEEIERSMRVVAFLGLNTVVNSLSVQMKTTATEARIGMAIESELRFRWFKKVNPALYEKVFGDLQRRERNVERRRAIMGHSMRTDDSGKATKWVPMEKIALARIGKLVLDLIVNNLDIVQRRMQRVRGNKMESVLQATDKAVLLLQKRLDTSGIRNPVFLPAVCSPKRWVTPLEGGYYSAMEELVPIRMVKLSGERTSTMRLRMLHETREKMPQVYRAINAVQATPWRINKPVLAVMAEAWTGSGLKIGKMPRRSSADTLEHIFPLEPYHEDLKTDLELYVAWKRRRHKVYTERAVQNSRVIQMERLIAMAEKFQNEQAIYFPTQLDFRGRMYAIPSFLNPQGTDCAKGLLTFARGCRLGKQGWIWLNIHVANIHGQDKLPFDKREEWSVENYDWIRECVKSPFEHREWMEADKPWQFLAAAHELVNAAESGDYENYFSHLPVTVDGTCNGLQHFSAMLLDRQGAAAVNLQPSDTPNDIYQIVADKVKVKFATMDDPYAKAWLTWGFDRKATKRAVMILPYSGTLHSAKGYIRDYVKEREDPRPWTDDFEATTFFSKHVWATIGETITSAGAVMKWLREVAAEVTKAKNTIKWNTPINFPVEQDNRELEHSQIETSLGQQCRYRPWLVRETEKLDASAQRLGISPNLVHSLDAACLMLTVNRALDEGIEDFAMVHDAYGVLAGRMETLYMGLRQAFVDIYQNDVLGDFLREATRGLAPDVQARLKASMPPKGEFELESVKDSKYFFA